MASRKPIKSIVNFRFNNNNFKNQPMNSVRIMKILIFVLAKEKKIMEKTH